jgi:hypothetical protein
MGAQTHVLSFYGHVPGSVYLPSPLQEFILGHAEYLFVKMHKSRDLMKIL